MLVNRKNRAVYHLKRAIIAQKTDLARFEFDLVIRPICRAVFVVSLVVIWQVQVCDEPVHKAMS